MKRIIIAIILVMLVLAGVIGGLAAIKASQIKTLVAAGAKYKPPPEAVASAPVRAEKWQASITAIGSIAAAQGVTITPEIPGTVSEVAFESGAVVSKGDLLLALDTSSEVAQLRAIEAQVELARLNAERERALRKDNMVPQSELDTAEATLKQNQANADNIRATIAKKTLRAPFSGKLGIRLVNLGQYLEAGKPVVSLQSLAPIYADFSLPQQELARLKPGMPVQLTTDTYPDRVFEGSLSAMNPDLDASTRSVGIQATFTNADQALRPGMFARVAVLMPEQQDVLVIPATAVLRATFGDSVYVLETKPEGTNAAVTVRQQFIRTGSARGDFVTVETGLKVGDKVVTAGAFKLRNGMAVVENNDLAPKSAAAPKPSDS
jgi:membrane fusion protein (multidrug efflux system)